MAAKSRKSKDVGGLICSQGGAASPSGPVIDGKAKFVKAILKAGHSVKRQDGKALDITPELLATMAESTNAFIANGGKVPAPAGADPHGLEADANANKGWWTGFVVNGDTLYATVELVADDAERLVQLTDVSISAPKSYTDSKGNEYDWPILHVALTPAPAITDLGEFVKIAASGRVLELPVYRLTQEQPMDSAWTDIAAALGVNAEGMEPDALKAACLAKIKALTASATTNATAAAALAAARQEVETLKASRTAKVDPDALEMAADASEAALTDLVKCGRIGAAVANDLRPVLIGTPEARAAVCLSRKAAEAAGFANPLTKVILAALAKNDPVECGKVHTKSQAVALNRQVPDGAPNTYDPAVTKEMSEMAFGRAS